VARGSRLASSSCDRLRHCSHRRNTRPQPLQQVIADAQRIRRNCQRRVDRRARTEKAAIDHVEIVDVVSAAVDVERRRLRIPTEPDCAVLVRDAGEGNSLPHEQISWNQVFVAIQVLQQTLQFPDQMLMGGLVIGLYDITMPPLLSSVTRLFGSGRSSDVNQKSSE
jgi:hypothetical protein